MIAHGAHRPVIGHDDQVRDPSDSSASPLPPEARAIVEHLAMTPHPEGGWFTETFRDGDGDAPTRSTAIYYLLGRGDRSHWHRVRHAAEVWHHYAGGPLRLSTSPDGETSTTRVLGTDLSRGERPQIVVERDEWQSAEPLGDWTLVGCTVAPGFEFDAFELAPPGWSPGSPLEY